MSKVNSGRDGYPANWVRSCDTCKAATCTLCCQNDSAYLCSSCSEHTHAANPMALPHEHVWVFAACDNAPETTFTCKADASSLCDNSLVSQVRIPPVSSLMYANSSTYPEEQQDPMLDPAEEIDEDEADSWLLLEPEDNNENKTNGGFAYIEVPNQSLGVLEYNSCTELQCQEQTNQQHLYCPYQGDSGSDGVVPVQSFEVKEQEASQQHQQQNQQQHKAYFSREYEAPKAASINTLSSSQSVPMAFINDEIVPMETISGISSSYTRYPNGTTDLFPNFSLLMPFQFTLLNREAKVLRYREKRKARKFEKKIRYASRKAYAEARPRVKGRFARKTEMDFEVDKMLSTEDYGYGIVPSYLKK